MPANATPPRVLFVIKRMTTGGAERHLTQVLPALLQRGIPVELFVLERGGGLEGLLTSAGVSVVGRYRKYHPALHLIVAAFSLFRHVVKKRPDVMHFFLPEPYLVGTVVASIAGQRNCIMSRRSLTHYHRIHPWLGRLERIFHRRMTALLGNSRAVVDELVTECRDRRKVGLIYNGLTPSPAWISRDSARSGLGIPADAFVMVIVANLVGYKGHADLLDALVLIEAKLPQPWRLIVIGRDEGVGEQLRTRAERGGLRDNVVWLGERADVETILPAAELGLLVSHQEGFSNALIEMMAQGMPVVATAIGGNVDAVADGRSGVLVPVQDSRRLAEAILDLARDPGRREVMGGFARQRVLTEFSLDRCVDRYERLYRGFARLSKMPVQSVIDAPLALVSK